MTAVAFAGWPVEAVEFYEGLGVDNSKAYWLEHKADYERFVKAPMDALLAELAGDFGEGRMFRPNRDVRFSKDKAPYKLNCATHLPRGFVSFSADGLFVGSGLYMPEPDQLRRLRDGIADDRTGRELEAIVTQLRQSGHEIGAHDVLKIVPRGYPKDHPRAELLRYKGMVTSRSWPVGPWLGTRKAKDRVVEALTAAAPLNSWLEQNVG